MNEKLTEKVRESGISAYRLAKESGVPYTNISELITGKKNINRRPAETVFKIAATLGCEPTDIMNPMSVMLGVSGIYKNMKYSWSSESGSMVLNIVHNGEKTQIRTPYMFCFPEKKATYMTVTALYLDMYIQDLDFARKAEGMSNG